jgi:glutamine cyclotransferase
MSTWDFSNNVLNGIAFDKETGDFFITGKRWSLLFKVKII